MPPAAARLFRAERVALASRYADLLCTDGVVRGLIGPREAPRIWDRHLLNCVLMAPALAPGQRVADIGSGAGLPGLVLAIARPDVHFTLIEPLLRRTTFLEEVVAELGLDNVKVERGRADVFHGKQSFDVVTARAVSALENLIAWGMPLVGAGGSLLVMKGSSAEDEVGGARAALEAWGCSEPEILELDDPDAGSVRLVRVGWSGEPRVSLRTHAGRARKGAPRSRGQGRKGRRNAQ
ncbi:16S rRNA (guanine(527)-N(7))-methyltransferase RsmG [Nocardioides sp. GY 10113]|nr:16S rRNA (guanine(527)-N(7))-methyltransferase RsmG [Nocardioides sp. GY 10113]